MTLFVTKTKIIASLFICLSVSWVYIFCFDECKQPLGCPRELLQPPVLIKALLIALCSNISAACPPSLYSMSREVGVCSQERDGARPLSPCHALELRASALCSRCGCNPQAVALHTPHAPHPILHCPVHPNILQLTQHMTHQHMGYPMESLAF